MVEALRTGDHARAIALLESDPTPNVRTLNMGVSSKLALGVDVSAIAFWMLDRCDKAAVKPTVSMYNNVLAGMSTRGDPNHVLAWVSRMEANGVEVRASPPCFPRPAYPLPTACHSLPHRPLLLPSPLQLDLIANNIRLKALGASGKLEEAVSVLRALASPDGASYNTLISAAFSSSRHELAEELLHEMLDKNMQVHCTTSKALALI